MKAEKAMAPHSSTLAWKIPWTEEPGRLQSVGSLRVGHDWATSLSLFHFHALEKEMATHSSVPAWRIPGTEEPSGLQSVGSHRVGHNWSDLAAAAEDERDTRDKSHFHTKRLWIQKEIKFHCSLSSDSQRGVNQVVVWFFFFCQIASLRKYNLN